ncbi:VOC family protein [Calidifontibacter indicus]|uniref:VOC family protein n=1 Tax=Calidifontibacter indicus TaxID=419650 RepID=UPI001FEC5A83|nr:VOC family protein [Calidifontibacter indicus]
MVADGGARAPLVGANYSFRNQLARIEADGARVVTAPETEPWGERYCQFADPNGIVWQLVQWMN